MQDKNIAVVFPGQGSQKQGMLHDFYDDSALVRGAFAEASEALGFDLWQMIQHEPGKLNQTEFTQPAILTASVAIWRLWQKQVGVRPGILAGHSLGEYSALVCAEALSLADAALLVHKRGQLMQDAVPEGEGAMGVILGLDDASVMALCDATSSEDRPVCAVNFNCPGQVVVAGNALAVKQALVSAKEAGAKRAMLLPVSVPSHCVLMKPAAEKLADYLDTLTLTTPIIPVLQNADLQCHQHVVDIKQALVKQLYAPVNWVSAVEVLLERGVMQVVECGPGKVLTSLNKRIATEATCMALNDLQALASFAVNEGER